MVGVCAGETTPYTLATCVERALQHNPDLGIACKRLEEAAGGIIEARAGYLPSLTSSARFDELENSYAGLNGTAFNRRNELWSVAIRLTENVYSGGAVAGRLAIARLNRDSRLLEYQAAVDRVIMETRIAFHNVLLQRAQIAVHQQAVAFLESEQANQRRRQKVGNSDRLQVARAGVSLALERTALVEARTQLLNAQVRLGELLAIPVATGTNPVPFEVTGELTYTPQSLDLATCLARAEELRPELRVHANNVAAQRRQLIVDRSALLPRVDLFVGYDVVSEPDRAAARDYYHGAMAGVAVTWQFFDGWAAKGRMQATRARIAAGDVALAAARRTVETEVVSAFMDLSQAEQTITAQRKNVALAEEALQLAQTNVELGSATQLELLQARLDLTRAQTVELTARFSYIAALARLQRAISSKFTVLVDGATGLTPVSAEGKR